MKLFKEFLSSEEQEREIEEIPAEELQGLAIKFVLGVRKKNGEEYEPSSIRCRPIPSEKTVQVYSSERVRILPASRYPPKKKQKITFKAI